MTMPLLETAVAKAVEEALQPPWEWAFAPGIILRVRRIAGKDLAFPMVYETLRRMERKGYLEVSLSEKQAKKGGRRRKMYRLTDVGKRALAESREALGRLQ